MFEERLAERPADAPGPYHFVLYPGRGKWVKGHVLCPRPRQYRVHYSPLLNRTLPCLKVMCWGCKGGQPLVQRDYLFLPMQLMRPKQLMVVGVQATHARPVWDHPEGGDYWRGLTLEIGRGNAQYDECQVNVLGRVPPDYPLPEAWDVGRDLEHVWQEHIPRQWDGRLTGPGQPEGADLPKG